MRWGSCCSPLQLLLPCSQSYWRETFHISVCSPTVGIYVQNWPAGLSFCQPKGHMFASSLSLNSVNGIGEYEINFKTVTSKEKINSSKTKIYPFNCCKCMQALQFLHWIWFSITLYKVSSEESRTSFSSTFLKYLVNDTKLRKISVMGHVTTKTDSDYY